MAVDRLSTVLLGTDETTGVTIASNGTSTGSETDALGGVTSFGFAHVYSKATCTTTAGTYTVNIYASRVAGQSYSTTPVFTASITPANGTQKKFLGTIAMPRYVTGEVVNNGIGANLTNVLVAIEIFKVS